MVRAYQSAAALTLYDEWEGHEYVRSEMDVILRLRRAIQRIENA